MQDSDILDGADFAHFIFVVIPGDIQPTERGRKYADPIDAALEAQGLGYVSGGGSQLGEPRPDGTVPIEFSGIDVETNDLVAARELLHKLLPELGAPPDTELQYSVDENELRDRFLGKSWSVGESLD